MLKMQCKICDYQSSPWKKTRVLKQYMVQYYCCDHCGFIQTEEPYWLAESYSEAIARNDIGLVNRNIAMIEPVMAVILSFFNCNERFIDYGGGYGLFVRLMRDRGFDFYRSDLYAPNLFAQGFDADTNGVCQYELLTAFEVFEHLVNPVETIREMLGFSSSILFSTFLVPMPPPSLEAWWYYSLDHGQHVVLYSLKSLKIIAQQLDLNIYSNRQSFHLLTNKNLSQTSFRVISNSKFSRLMNSFLRTRLVHKSLLSSDFEHLTGKRIKN